MSFRMIVLHLSSLRPTGTQDEWAFFGGAFHGRCPASGLDSPAWCASGPADGSGQALAEGAAARAGDGDAS